MLGCCPSPRHRIVPATAFEFALVRKVHDPCWWRGLDSNQRTLARADLQSAAFNHSATPPGAAGAPCGGPPMVCQRVGMVVAASLCELSALQISVVPGLPKSGAGEGNRTPVVSLEGFCSTIELHPQTFGKKCFSPEKPKPFYRRFYACPRIRSPIATTILPWSTYVRRMPSTWSGDQPISSAIS